MRELVDGDRQVGPFILWSVAVPTRARLVSMLREGRRPVGLAFRRGRHQLLCVAPRRSMTAYR